MTKVQPAPPQFGVVGTEDDGGIAGVFPSCSPSSGGCYEAHADQTPGCNDSTCCNIVCDEDAFCCETDWDQTCADFAWLFCDGPSGIGGCCVEEACQGIMAVEECAALGGIWLEGDDCDVTGCPAGNDPCGGAVPITQGNTAYTTLGATTDGPGGCSANQDIWYSFTADCTGDITVTTCDNADYDTYLAAYDGCACPATDARQLVCNDDACGLQSTITFSANEGDCYLIRVGGFGGGEGTGTVNIACDAAGIGTCCVNENCVGTMTPSECAAQDGIFLETDNCINVTCPSGNDACAGSVPIFQGDTNFDTSEATTDGPAHAACLAFGDDQVNQDIWYDFTADCTGEVTVSTCNTAQYDTRLAVYDGCVCPVTDGRLLACNDDGVGCAGFSSLLTFTAIEGNCYKIRIGGFTVATGTGTVNINCDVLPDACSPDAGDCYNAHADQSPGCNDVACCDIVCEQDDFCCTTDWDDTCAAFAWTFCEGPSGIGGCCVDEVCIGLTTGPECDAQGGFWFETDDCSTIACPSGNDVCQAAAPIFQGSTNYSTVGATEEGPPSTGCATVNQDIWYTFTADCTGDITVDTCSNADYDTNLAAYEGCECPVTQARQVACNDDACGILQSSLTFVAIEGTCYLIRVGGFGGGEGTGTVNITCDVLPDACSPDAGDCYNAHADQSPGCNDVECCDIVCEQDDFCCTTDWDDTCAAFAWTFCEGPSGIGGCCVDEQCIGLTTGPECAAQDGIWFETDDCSTISCPSGNDACAGSVPIFQGDTNFDTSQATTDGPPHAACLAFGDDQVNQDIWYDFTADCTGEITVTTCGTAYDTKIAAYDGCECPVTDGRLLACNDDDCGLQSTILFTAIEGNCYKIRIGGFGGATGTGTVNIDCAALPDACSPDAGDCYEAHADQSPGCNDVECCDIVCEQDDFCCTTDWDDTCAAFAWTFCDGPSDIGACCIDDACSGPMPQTACAGVWFQGRNCDQINCASASFDDCPGAPIEVGSSIDGTTLEATIDDSFATCGTTIAAPGVWFRVTGNGHELTATTCLPATNYDTKLNVFCGSCNTPICIGGNDDGSPSGTNPDPACVVDETGSTFNRASTVTWCSQQGAIYYILVQGFAGATGDFGLEVLDGPACNDPIPGCAVVEDCPGGAVVFVDPADGTVDARQPHPVGNVDEAQGMQQFTVTAPAGAATDCWSYCQSPAGGPGNNIDTVVEDNGTYVITLVRPLAPGMVGTLTYDGNQTGRFTAHPANANADSASTPADIIDLIDYLNGVTDSPWGIYSEDINRSDLFEPSDIITLIDLLNGAGQFTVWNNTPLPDGGDCP